MNPSASRFPILVLLAASMSLATLAGCDRRAGEEDIMTEVAGIESISLDGRRYFFGYSYRRDRVLTPLFSSADSIADHAEKHFVQLDGRHDKRFWLDYAQRAQHESDLSDEESERIFALDSFREAVRSLKEDPRSARLLPGLTLPPHLFYLMEMNCAWPDELDLSESEAAAAQRIGLEAGDVSPWLEESASMLSGRSAMPAGASFHDAASVFLRYYDTLVRCQRYGWSEQLALP